jgi:hypothetical protein
MLKHFTRLVGHLKCLIFVFIQLIIGHNASGASIYKIEPGQAGIYEIHIDGEIVAGDADRLIDLLKESPLSSFVRVALDSKGGSVAEAMKISSIVKDLYLGTKVKPRGICASACFFIWLSGWTRSAGFEPFTHLRGPVGLHRPFLRNPSADQPSLQYQTLLQNQVAAYFREQLLPARLIDEMMRRPSNDIYLLTKEDLKELGPHPAPLEEVFIKKCKYDRRNEDVAAGLEVANRDQEASILRRKMDIIYDCMLDVRFEARDSNIREFQQKLRIIGAQEKKFTEATNVDEEEALVSRVHPDWRIIVKSTDFRIWKDRQSAAIQKLSESVKAVDAIRMLDEYKADREKARNLKQIK